MIASSIVIFLPQLKLSLHSAWKCSRKGFTLLSLSRLRSFSFKDWGLQIVQGNCGSTSNKLQQNLFYRAIDKVDERNNILKVPKNPIGGTC